MKFRNLSKISRKIKVALFRRKLEKADFFEDITFEDKEEQEDKKREKSKILGKEVKKIIAEWMFNLHEAKQIKIDKFKDLFTQVDEISFPIKITEHYTRKVYIIFLDNKGKEYYMASRNMEDYIIGGRNSLLEPLINRHFYYKILKDKTIVRIKSDFIQLEQERKNKNVEVDFCYNYEEHTTEATLFLDSLKNRIKIKYPTIGDEFDKRFLKFLFNIQEKTWYYYNLFPIFKWIMAEISDEKPSISITACIDEEIYSEIDVRNGILQKYITKKIPNEGKWEIYVNIFCGS